jgi:hypothetical protein
MGTLIDYEGNVRQTDDLDNTGLAARVAVLEGAEPAASLPAVGDEGDVLTTILGNWGPAPIGGAVQKAFKMITAAQLRAMSDTPVQVLASPGAGKANILVHAIGVWFGATPIADFNPYLADSSGTVPVTEEFKLLEIAGPGVTEAVLTRGFDPADVTDERYYLLGSDNATGGGTGEGSGHLDLHLYYVTIDV